MIEKNDPNMGNNKPKKSILYYYGLILLVVMVLNAVFFPSVMQRRVQEVEYSQFMTAR